MPRSILALRGLVLPNRIQPCRVARCGDELYRASVILALPRHVEPSAASSNRVLARRIKPSHDHPCVVRRGQILHRHVQSRLAGSRRAMRCPALSRPVMHPCVALLSRVSCCHVKLRVTLFRSSLRRHASRSPVESRFAWSGEVACRLVSIILALCCFVMLRPVSSCCVPSYRAKSRRIRPWSSLRCRI